VNGGRTVPAQRRLVDGRRIALVALERVGREVVGLPAHQAVPHHLGQHGRRRDGRTLGVTVHDGPDRAGEVVLVVAQQVDRTVHQDRLWWLVQPGDGAARRHP